MCITCDERKEYNLDVEKEEETIAKRERERERGMIAYIERRNSKKD